MSILSFRWKGVSSDDHGVVVKSLPPITGWMRRDDGYSVPGRDGALHIQDGAVEEASWAIEIYLPYEQGVTVTQISEIKKWLRGYGELWLSDRPEHFFKAHIIDEISFEAWVQGYSDRIATVYFEVEPYGYRVNSPASMVLNGASGIISNPGSAVSKPRIVVTGSGDVSISIAGQVLEINGLSGSIEIDTELLTVLSGGIPAYHMISGEFPVLMPGNNAYSAVGSVTRIEIESRWRDV